MLPGILIPDFSTEFERQKNNKQYLPVIRNSPVNYETKLDRYTVLRCSIFKPNDKRLIFVDITLYIPILYLFVGKGRIEVVGKKLPQKTFHYDLLNEKTFDFLEQITKITTIA